MSAFGLGVNWRTRLVTGAVALSFFVSACGDDDEEVASGCLDETPPAVSDGFSEPEVRTSENGVLETTLKGSYGEVEIDGETVETMNFEGSVPAPTLAVCPGDKLIVHFENDLGDTPASWNRSEAEKLPGEHDLPQHEGQLSNLHTHGFHVSPKGNSDNVLLSFKPGEDFTYEYEIPEDHPPGMYWYHPHRHGFVEPQIYAGMYGAIYVQGGLDETEGIEQFPTRTMEIMSMQVEDGAVVPVQVSKTQKSPYYLNGQLEPDLEIGPGEIQRWRILNADDNAIVNLELEGHEFYVLANDGNTLTSVSPQRNLLMGPGERREVLVQGGEDGSYQLKSLEFSQFQGGSVPESTVATLDVTGDEVDDELPADPLLSDQEDLRTAKVDQEHRIVYSEEPLPGGLTEFQINGRPFNPDVVNETMKLGEVNQWLLINATSEWHTFHIHINDFQVTAYKPGNIKDVSQFRPQDVFSRDIDPEDTVKMPPGSGIVMRTRPTDFTGKFVFHCHMVNHEDRGMMGIVRVVE